MRLFFSCSIAIIIMLTLSACTTTTLTPQKGDPLRRNTHIVFRDLTTPHHEVTH